MKKLKLICCIPRTFGARTIVGYDDEGRSIRAYQLLDWLYELLSEAIKEQNKLKKGGD